MSTAQAVERRPRGEERRRRILEAALTIVGSRGAGAVTHRAVATEAGVPLAATTYYFASREHLLAEALEHAVEQDLGQLERDATRLFGPPVTPDRLVEGLCDLVDAWLEGERPTLLAQYEILLEAARRPGLARTTRAWTDAYLDAFAPALASAGSAEPRADAWIVYSALCGMVLEQLTAPVSDFREVVLRPALRRLLAGLVCAGARP